MVPRGGVRTTDTAIFSHFLSGKFQALSRVKFGKTGQSWPVDGKMPWLASGLSNWTPVSPGRRKR